MNEIFIRMGIASLLQAVKNKDKKATLREICRAAVKGILLAYQDDPTFLQDDE